MKMLKKWVSLCLALALIIGCIGVMPTQKVQAATKVTKGLSTAAYKNLKGKTFAIGDTVGTQVRGKFKKSYFVGKRTCDGSAVKDKIYKTKKVKKGYLIYLKDKRGHKYTLKYFTKNANAGAFGTIKKGSIIGDSGWKAPKEIGIGAYRCMR